MFLILLSNSPAVGIVWISVILISITVHEFSHAWAASYKGDKTAELAGRLTLNPMAHIDPLGLVPLILLGFGWAKPVPFNPYNLKDPKNDAVFIALAGPASNLILALIAAILFRAFVITGFIDPLSLLSAFLILIVVINLFLLFFNILPIHPLDGSKLVDALLTKPQHAKFRVAIATYGPQLLLVLIILSILTSFNVFFFVSTPSYFICDIMTGQSCTGFLALILGI
ncbi:site-2 protease family protein [Patescibacteria group bacterium]|nr:site-2 protease family protein [Patescibacteria group bacterium]